LSRSVEVVRTYLELRSPAQLRPAPSPSDVRFVRRDGISVEAYRRLYEDVGDQWYWRDRNVWTDAQLAHHLARREITVWECLAGHESAGYFELDQHDDGSVEIAYFGLRPEFFGRGIGKAMLTRAAEEAWSLGAQRVWLHTCTLDSTYALPNYLARGFTQFRQESFTAELPDPE